MVGSGLLGRSSLSPVSRGSLNRASPLVKHDGQKGDADRSAYYRNERYDRAPQLPQLRKKWLAEGILPFLLETIHSTAVWVCRSIYAH